MTEALHEARPPARRREVVSMNAADVPLERFFARIGPQGYRFARACALDHDAALDAVQASGLRLIERYAARPEAEWPALFFAILRNAIHDARRWRWRWNRPLSSHGDDAAGDELRAEPADAEQATAEGRYARQRQRRALEQALAALPLRQRQVFLLREWQGFSVEETARILGCSPGAVKQHHYRALRTLRGKLSEVWDEQA